MTGRSGSHDWLARNEVKVEMGWQSMTWTVLRVLCAVGLVGVAACAHTPVVPDTGLLDGLITPQRYQARRESSSDDDLYKNADARSIRKGETLVLGELEGPGIITHIWTTVGSQDPFHGRSLVLRAYWDGATRPSVEVPLGDFFGVGHGALADFTSLPVAVSSHGRARNCYWRMPFRKSAKVTVTNESETYNTDAFYYYLDWQKHPSLPEDTPYFHAQYRQAMPATAGDYVILETKGRGHYVGTVQSAHQVEMGWFGEGDDRFYIDGETFPSLRGTGTEDYYGHAWGFRPFSTPYLGVSLWEGYFPGDRVTAYRWHVRDPIPFTKSLKVTIEHRGSVYTDTGKFIGPFFERPDHVSSVAFWYQSPAATFSEPLPQVSERIAPYRVLRAASLEVRATPETGLSKTGPAVSYTPGRGDAKIEFDFRISDAGRYQINAFIYHSVFGSVYEAFLDDQSLGTPLDLCLSGQDPLWVGFDLHDLKPGTHTLRFEGRGESPKKRSKARAAHAFGMTHLVLLRLEDLEGYHVTLEEARK